MEIFHLPQSTKVNRVVPKNAFDAYINAKQKKIFTDLIARITWTHKISKDTINLEAKDIKEIQIFKIELKVKEEILSVLNIIDKAIPYHMIFIVKHEENTYLSTSIKHLHPTKADTSVIDWTFRTTWFLPSEKKYFLQLKNSLDAVFLDFCIQVSGEAGIANKSLLELVTYKKQVDTLEKEIDKLKAGIIHSKQFNQKVELNIELKTVEDELKLILSSSKKNKR